jgi:hypothetical protein
MSLERVKTIPLKAIMALQEFDAPESYCVALAIDGLLDGHLSYGDWQMLCRDGVSAVGTMRIIRQIVVPVMGFENGIGFCRGDQVENQELFSQRIATQVSSTPSRLVVATQSQKEGHVQSLVTYKPGLTVEYNSVLPEMMRRASELTIRTLVSQSLAERVAYFYSFGFILNPKVEENADLSEYLMY